MWPHSCPLLPARHTSCIENSASANVSVFNEFEMKFSKRTNPFRCVSLVLLLPCKNMKIE